MMPVRPRGGVLIVMMLALGGSAGAQGTQAEADERYVVERLDFAGVERIDEAALRSVLATRSSPWWPWGDERYFDPEAFEVDLRRVVAYYRDHGFPDAHVVSHDVDVDEDAAEVAITIRVEEGEPLVVDGIVFEGFDVLSAERLERLRDELPIAAGDRAVHPLILAGGELAVTALKNEGYAHAEVQVEQDDVAPKRRRVRYTATPGMQAVFGPVEVVGNLSVDDNIVRRQLTYRPGQLYRLDQVRDSQRRLFTLELFEFATIEPLQTGDPAEVPTRVVVVEGDHRRVTLAGGWGTEEKVNGEIGWRNVFFGGARVLAARGKWSSLEHGGEVDFRQPYVFHPGLALALNGHTWYADELAYSARSEGGRVSIESRLSPRLSWRATYTHEFASSQISNMALADLTQRETLIALGLDPTTGEQDGVLSSISFELQHTTTQNPLSPRDGYTAAVLLEQAGTLLAGDFNYTNLSADLRGYLPLGDTVVVAGRLHGAVIDPAGTTDDVPFFKRYFLGGSTSLRGWGRFEVAPLSGAGLPLGGFSLFESTAEVRGQFWRNLGLVAFLDAGNVWRDAWTFRGGDLRYDAGPGLTYTTPVGPLRVDLAYQLNPIPELLVDGQPQTRRWRIHFRIGQSF